MLTGCVFVGELPDSGAGAAANAAIRAALAESPALAVYAGHGGARIAYPERWPVD